MISASTIARRTRRGLTLIEIMIALTMTLIVLGAMMSAFSFASNQMQLGRSVMEMANRLRSAEELFRSDLANLTLDPRSFTETTLPKGYFEYNESTDRDLNLSGPIDIANSYQGDIDDSLGLTVRSSGRAFRGRLVDTGVTPNVTAVIESPLAEVFWYTSFRDLNPPSGGAPVTIDFEDTVRVHRRVLLIRPDLGQLLSDVTLAEVNRFIAQNDISVRVVQRNFSDSFDVWANNLTDLGVRRNRFAHLHDTFNASGFINRFPNPIDPTLLFNRRPHDLNLNPTNSDVLLTDVASFDLKVYSINTNVRVFGAAGIVAEPSDPGFFDSGGALQANGAFVDLGHAGSGWFGGAPSAQSQLGFVYDTWTPLYESDGINQDDDTDTLTDEGTDGIDNGGTAAPDDSGERETAPPYPFPIRGIKATFRLIEKNTKQVHQSSVIQSFVPE